MLHKKLLFGLSLMVGLAFTACLPESACKYCSAVTYDTQSGQEVDRQDATEYCGDELDDKEFAEPVVFGSDSTIWECNN